MPGRLADRATDCTFSRSDATCLVDGHVHIHPCFDRRRFFDAAAANFDLAAEELGLPRGTPGILMLTETAGTDAFGELAAGAPDQVPGWSVTRTGEAVSLRMTRPGGHRVYVIAGRQIVTADRLEVLALATRTNIPDGQPLEATVEALRAAGALPVIPWGFGKWTGARKRRLAEFLHGSAGDGVLLGDNGGRLDFGPPPSLLVEARRRGVAVVPGSDPLPFPSQTGRAGRYGFVLTAGLDPHRPARTVVEYLMSRKDLPCPFGRLTPLPAFLLSQLRMQWRARLPIRS